MNVDILTSLHVWYSIDLLDKTTVAMQRTAKGRRFTSLQIELMDNNPVGVVTPGFADDEDDGGDGLWEDEDEL